MHSKEQIIDKVTSMIEELFEVPKSNIKLESRLFEDLELDSIDAIDLITELQSYIGKRLDPEQFKNVRTVADIVTASENILKAQENKAQTDQLENDK